MSFADHQPKEGEAPQRLKALMHPRASELSPWGSQELFLYCPDTHRYFQEAPDGKELVEVMIPPEEEPHFREIVGATPPEEGLSDASALSGNESTTNPPSEAEKSGQSLPPVDEVEETDPASTTDAEAEKAPLVLIRNQGQGSPNPVPFIQKSRKERVNWCREIAQLSAYVPTRPHRMVTKAKKKGNYMPIWCPDCNQEGRHSVHCEAAPEVPVGVIVDNRTQCVYTYVVFADGDPVPNNGWDINTHLYGEILITQCAPDLGARWVLTQDELTHRFFLRDRAPISLDARPRTPWFSWIGFGVKVKCEKCQHSYGHEENCVWEDAPVFLEYHPTKANHYGSLVDNFGKERHHCGGPGLGTITLYPSSPNIPREFKVIPLNPMEVTLKAIAPSNPAEGKSSPKGRYDGFGDIKKSEPQGNQAAKALKPEGKSSQGGSGGSGDPQPPIPFCDHCRATDCCELYSHSTPECLCCIPNPVEDSDKEESSSEDEQNLPASPVFTKKAQPAAVSASGRSLLDLGQGSQRSQFFISPRNDQHLGNYAAKPGQSQTADCRPQFRTRQPTPSATTGRTSEKLLENAGTNQCPEPSQRSEVNKREVQRVLDRMEVKAAERRAVVRENQLKREMEAGLKEASEPSAVSSTDAWIMNELRRLQQEVGELKKESTKAHSGSVPPWEKREEVPLENKPLPTHFPTRDGPPAMPIPTWRESREEARNRTYNHGLRPPTNVPATQDPLSPGPSPITSPLHRK